MLKTHVMFQGEFETNIDVSLWGATREAHRMLWTDTTSLDIGSWNGSMLQCLWKIAEVPGAGIPEASIKVNSKYYAYMLIQYEIIYINIKLWHVITNSR